jgi:hypothetical protein
MLLFQFFFLLVSICVIWKILAQIYEWQRMGDSPAVSFNNLSLQKKKKKTFPYQILHTSADFDECFCTTTAQGNKREFWKRVILRSDREEVK